jgi:4,5-dihydroxyphthalate decarboxylase
MSRLALTFACGRFDRMEALRSGEVRPEGIDLNYIPIEDSRETFDRMVGGREFDVSELSSSEFISMTGMKRCPFVALPVFPSRAFRHSYVYVNRRSGIARPQDLAGKRIGITLYTQTAAIWIRGHLTHQYGVDLSRVRWVQGAVEKAGSHGQPHALPLLVPAPVVPNESPYSLSELLARGEIDALIGSRKPDSLDTDPDVVRLFPDYRSVEREFYQATRIFPIMHLVAMRRELYEAHPWVASSLYKAFVQSKRLAMQRLRFSGTLATMLPWQWNEVAEIDEVFGGDAFPYGVQANRPTLEAMMQYMVEQHFIPAHIPLEELFVPLPHDIGT